MENEKPAVLFFPIVLVLKKGIYDAFCDAFSTRPPFPWEPHPTHPTLLKLLTLTLTPHYRQTQLYHHLVAVVSVDLTTNTFWPTMWSVDCLLDFWTEKPGDGDAFRRTRIDGWNKCQLPHPLINWLIYQQICGDSYWQTQIYGWRIRAVSISSETSIFTCQSIDQFIDLSTYR